MRPTNAETNINKLDFGTWKLVMMASTNLSFVLSVINRLVWPESLVSCADFLETRLFIDPATADSNVRTIVVPTAIIG